MKTLKLSASIGSPFPASPCAFLKYKSSTQIALFSATQIPYSGTLGATFPQKRHRSPRPPSQVSALTKQKSLASRSARNSPGRASQRRSKQSRPWCSVSSGPGPWPSRLASQCCHHSLAAPLRWWRFHWLPQ